MEDKITIDFLGKDKKSVYEQLNQQLEALIAPDQDLIASLGNTAALLNEVLRPLWVGFYIVKNEKLVLGPFQGPIACVHIAFGKGVCGKAWETKQPQLVPNVHEFQGHIACSSLSNSEIVVPIFNAAGDVVMVLDIDSENFAQFDEEDQQGLEQLAAIISKYYFN